MLSFCLLSDKKNTEKKWQTEVVTHQKIPVFGNVIRNWYINESNLKGNHIRNQMGMPLTRDCPHKSHKIFAIVVKSLLSGAEYSLTSYLPRAPIKC